MIYLIIIFGLLIRLISINQSLWLDESTSALAAKMSLTDLFTKFLPGDFHPPLYYLLLKYWIIMFGSSEVALRIPSLIFGVGTVYVTYLISKKLFTKKVALISALLLATSGLSVYYSQEARMYSMAALLVSLSVYFFIENRFVLFSVVLTLIGMTDYVALFVLPVFWYWGFNKKKFLLANIPLAMVFLAWIPLFSRQLFTGLSVRGSAPGWWRILGSVTLKNILLFPVKFSIGRISFDDKVIYGLVVIPVLVLFGYLVSCARKDVKFLWFWLTAPVLIGVVIGFWIPTLTYFRFLFCLPPLYILAAKGLAGFRGMKFKILLVALILVNIFSTGYYLISPKLQRENWRGLTAFVESQKETNSITIFVADSNMEAYRYYAPDAKIAGPEALRVGYNQVWLMRYLQGVFDPGDTAKHKTESLGYSLAGKYNFNGVEVWEYKK